MLLSSFPGGVWLTNMGQYKNILVAADDQQNIEVRSGQSLHI